MLIKTNSESKNIKEYYSEKFFQENNIIIDKIMYTSNIDIFIKNDIVSKEKLRDIIYSLIYLCKEWNESIKKRFESKIYEFILKLKEEKVFLDMVYELWIDNLYKIDFPTNNNIFINLLSMISNNSDLEKVMDIYRKSKWFNPIIKREIINLIDKFKNVNISDVSDLEKEEDFKNKYNKLSLIRTFKEEDFDYYLENIDLFEEKDRKKIVEVYLWKSSYKARMDTFLSKIKDTSIIVENKDFLLKYAMWDKRDLIVNCKLFYKMIAKYSEKNKDIFKIFPINEEDMENDITLLTLRLLHRNGNRYVIKSKILSILKNTNHWELKTIVEIPSSSSFDLTWKTVNFFNPTNCNFNRRNLIDSIKNQDDISELLIEFNKHRLFYVKDIDKNKMPRYQSLDTIFYFWINEWCVLDAEKYISTTLDIYNLNKKNFDYIYLFISKILFKRDLIWDISKQTLNRLIDVLNDFPNLEEENKNRVLSEYIDFYLSSIENWNKNIQIFLNIFLKKYYPNFFNF